MRIFCLMVWLFLPVLAGAVDEVEEQEVVTRLNQACEAGDGSACANLAAMYFDGVGVTRDQQRAVALMDRACSLGDSLACENLARLYEQGEVVQASRQRAASLYAKACLLDDEQACKKGKQLQ